MIEIGLTAQVLAGAKFAADPVWEAVAALSVLSHARGYPMSSHLRARVPARPDFDLGLLLDLTRCSGWVPSLLTPIPVSGPMCPADRLAAVATTPLDLVVGDQAVLRRLDPGSRLATMDAEDLACRASHALGGFWSAVLDDLWERVESVLCADISHRALSLVSCGLRRTIGDLDPAIRCRADRIQVATESVQRPRTDDHEVLWFVPSAFRWPNVVVVERSRAVVVSYPARGFARVWDTDSEDSPAPLVQLLGRSRTAILEQLDVPRTTTNLSHRLGLAPGTVSGHLSVLTEAGLLHARRDGRRVLYARNALACVLIGQAHISSLPGMPGLGG